MATAGSTSQTRVSDVHLGRLLQDRGVINEHQLIDALRAQAASGGRLGSILVHRGCLTDDQLEAVLRSQDDLRRAGVAVDLGVIVPAQPAPGHSVAFGLGITVPTSGSQGGLPHVGFATRQRLLIPTAWLDGTVTGQGSSDDGLYSVQSEDGRIIGFEIAFRLRAVEPPLHLPAGRRMGLPEHGDIPAGEELVDVTVMVQLSPDALRDGGAGRFSGRFDLVFEPA